MQKRAVREGEPEEWHGSPLRQQSAVTWKGRMELVGEAGREEQQQSTEGKKRKECETNSESRAKQMIDEEGWRREAYERSRSKVRV